MQSSPHQSLRILPLFLHAPKFPKGGVKMEIKRLKKERNKINLVNTESMEDGIYFINKKLFKVWRDEENKIYIEKFNDIENLCLTILQGIDIF